jgi:hypothetical protein
MSCGTGECGCGCVELHQVWVKPGVLLKVATKEREAEGPKAVLAGTPERSNRSRS